MGRPERRVIPFKIPFEVYTQCICGPARAGSSFGRKASLVLGISEAIKATYDLGLSNSRAALVVRSSERTRNLR